MKNFYSEAVRISSRNTNSPSLQQQFNVIFGFIDRLQKSQAKANIDLHNIESIYTALEMSQLLKLEDLKKPSNWQELRTCMAYFLTKTIEDNTKFQYTNNFPRYWPDSGTTINLGNNRKTIDSVIQQLCKLQDSWDITIVSFNYDLVVEALLCACGLQTRYCLESEPDNLKSDSVKLLKLHGSINWERREVGQTKAGRAIKDLVAHHYYIKNKRNENKNFIVDPSSKDITTNFSENITPFIVPPIWNKSSYHNDVSDVWQEAAKALSKATHIYTAGYSLPQTDGFFRQLYALGTVGSAPLQDFRVFDIEPEDSPNGVNSRFQNLLGRGAENVYTYHSEGLNMLATQLACFG
ncbi:hypothetical protein [Idiomarina sp.]|uniref:hypothetical protein n=1 Tax=Idiomarina sp. TaxID=1874361 RepID=UPI0025B9316A|nr:hypothetical protein [Idiomarina sp.]